MLKAYPPSPDFALARDAETEVENVLTLSSR